MYYIVIKLNFKGKWFWHLKHKNGRILAHSEQYASKQRAVKTAKALAKSLKCEIK